MVAIATIGHSSRSGAAFVALLQRHGIVQLADVRSYPGSRRHPQFARACLERDLPAAGIAYRWLPHLGGKREGGGDDRDSALAGSPFAAYARHMRSPRFVETAEGLLAWAAEGRTALMCAEADPSHCHRSYLCDWLLLRGAAVRHIVATGEVRNHQLSPLARADDGGVVYDRGQLSLL